MKKIIICLMFFSIILICMWHNYFYTKTYNGIDISHHNNICWKCISKDSNIKFCYIKATEGKSFIDNKCEINAKKAKQINLNVGLYHYFKTDVSAKEQFNNFKIIFNKVNPNLIPVIDVEKTGNDFSNINKVNKNLSKLISLFYNEYKTYPIIYFESQDLYKIFKSTYKCKYWISCTIHPNRKPNFTIKQYKIGNIGCNTLDLNYCSDLNEIKL